MRCARCGGPVLMDGDGEAYCIWCGEYFHKTPPLTTSQAPAPRNQARAVGQHTDWWEPPADLEFVGDLPPNMSTGIGYRADGRRKPKGGWH